MSSKDKDFLPMVVGIFMLFLASYVGYSVGVSSSQIGLSDQCEAPVANFPIASPTLSPEDDFEQTPDEWQSYDSFFGLNYFAFRFPVGYDILDADPRTGQINIVKQGSYGQPDVVIDSLNHTFFFEQYDEKQAMKDWFLSNIKRTYPNTDFSSLVFDKFSFSDGVEHISISRFPDSLKEINPALFSGTWYVRVENQIPVYVIDTGKMDERTFKRILFTVRVRK